MRITKRRNWIWISSVVVVALVLGGLGMAWWYQSALQPRSATAKRIRVMIDAGASSDTIAAELERQGVIKSALAFNLYIKQQGARDKLQAGNYLLSPTQSPAEILSWLIQGKVDTYSVTIYPGKTLAEIKQQLIKSGFAAEAIDAAFAKTYNHPLLADKPVGVNLEGYIFPETYQINSETTVEQLLTRTFDEFKQQIDSKGLRQALAARGLNLHQGITLASIVGREVVTDEDRRQVAQVFEKRLAQNMFLGSDPTFMYAAKLTGQPASPSIDSPYNTYQHKGLPPGAIGNFTLPVLDAVAHPAPGEYLYFVAGDDGVTHYALTAQEHDQNVRQYCIKLCGR